MSPLHRVKVLIARIASVMTILAMLATTLATSAGPASAQDSGPIKVVATFSILADWVQTVGGDNIELTTIVPAGGDAHTFDPNPEQVASIADADLIFEIGLGFESWLDDMYEASGSSATRIEVSDGVRLLSLDDEHEDHEEGEEEGEDHDHGAHDPHMWGEVYNAITAVQIINANLNDVDPANVDSYNAKADAYLAELETLTTYIFEQTETIPDDDRKLVTTHDTFGYYARAYDFEIVGTALNSMSTEGGDPPARDIAELVSEIQAQEVPAIFAENVSNNDLMQVIADEAGVELAPPLYTDALGEPGSDGETYIAMMTYNTDTIVAALSGD